MKQHNPEWVLLLLSMALLLLWVVEFVRVSFHG